MRIAMWSGPRNLSTAMMYAFASRSDCSVIDEPFYAAYLKASGEIHPMQEQILASQPVCPQKVIEQCLADIPENKQLFYQKQMTHHMLPQFELNWIKQLTNVFLIRHPARVIASYHKKREFPRLEDIGVPQQKRLFQLVSDFSDSDPIVIDSDDILADPETMLSKLCLALEIPFLPQMLSWPAGGNKNDGVWASHWYNRVWSSTGLSATPIKPLPNLTDRGEAVLDQALPVYQKLEKYKL